MEQFIMEFMTSLIKSGAIIVIFCYCVGFTIKKTIKLKKYTRYIPLLNLFVGGFVSVFVRSIFSHESVIERFMYGAICGVVATIAHETVMKSWIENRKAK